MLCNFILEHSLALPPPTRPKLNFSLLSNARTYSRKIVGIKGIINKKRQFSKSVLKG